MIDAIQFDQTVLFIELDRVNLIISESTGSTCNSSSLSNRYAIDKFLLTHQKPAKKNRPWNYALPRGHSVGIIKTDSSGTKVTRGYSRITRRRRVRESC